MTLHEPSHEAYLALETQERQMHAVRGALSMLHWDRAVMMPSGSAPSRAEQTAGLSRILHGMVTAPQRGDLIDKALENQSSLDDWSRANLNEIHRGYVRATALSPDLVERKARLGSETEMNWRQARQDNDFSAITGSFAALLELVREEAAILAETLSRSPYDALLDKYEPDLRLQDVEQVFAGLESELPGLLNEVLEHQAAQGGVLPLDGPFPVSIQEKLSREIMVDLGFDFNTGRLDVSHHPFSGGVPGDIRVTTRYDEDGFIQALMATIHETGHALYEAGLPEQWRAQPVGNARGMVLHESQSLLFEMQAARSPQFVEYLAARARAAFGGQGTAWQSGNLLRHYHHVSRGLIRVYADEVSYPLHVILRTKLEREMISGTLKVSDIPDAWNAGMETYLGVRSTSDSEGCLQDIHWYSGAFGYFPTYTLGALAAAQIYRAAVDENPEITEHLARGDVAILRSWLAERIHMRASR
ncbi:MAG: carboxypeptidase M32, partial [Fimbriimonadaceae bacterium]|nr:carboxypeptidase M32 [Alphaproteobacteria bacterium]